ncbi:hypothetical protein SLA2020_286860 [Shorea laevis]
MENPKVAQGVESGYCLFTRDKLEVISREVIRSVWGCLYVDWLYLGSRGASGGILLMWDRRVVEKVEECVGRFVVACAFRSVTENFEWAFAGIYGPNDDVERRGLWDELAGLMALWDLPWCMGGDFNVVRYPGERIGESRHTQAMVEFSEFIFEQGLLDIPLEGGRFTWSNGREVEAWSKIDRFLLSTEWEEHFPDVSQKRLPRLVSDHFPLMLDCGVGSRGRRSFKFENMWLHSVNFVDQVKQWWNSYHFEGAASYVLAQKLRALKIDLKKWNEEVFGDVGQRKKEMIEGLSELDLVAEGRSLNEEEKSKRVEYSKELERSIFMEEVSWRQKSRALWLKEGDNNTKFFHRLANSNRRHNSIESLVVDGDTIVDSDRIKDHIVEFYKTLYAEQYRWRPKVNDLSFTSIDDGEQSWMEESLRTVKCGRW